MPRKKNCNTTTAMTTCEHNTQTQTDILSQSKISFATNLSQEILSLKRKAEFDVFWQARTKQKKETNQNKTKFN